MHGLFVREMPETTDEKETWNRLRKADLKVESEAMLYAGVKTNHVRSNPGKTAQSPL